jgi:hypothetical protein
VPSQAAFPLPDLFLFARCPPCCDHRNQTWQRVPTHTTIDSSEAAARQGYQYAVKHARLDDKWDEELGRDNDDADADVQYTPGRLHAPCLGSG